jgi:hypothetical protein
MKMIDVHLPTSNSRTISTQPSARARLPGSHALSVVTYAYCCTPPLYTAATFRANSRSSAPDI